ncbi:hypothetical protein SAY87_028391 [Trapa incisa]|uniref:EF-hand domain-containing protein n=1 Tax=Trapa incisa TaxID=236973 RepID=A0AAN7QP42_9MYRT|nr:hypothetical protein SAY87_028391 [Trapa incisa]
MMGMLDERTPSFEEVKEAFHRPQDLPPYNGISDDDCGNMIRDFDNSGDGAINLREFTTLIEKSQLEFFA